MQPNQECRQLLWHYFSQNVHIFLVYNLSFWKHVKQICVIHATSCRMAVEAMHLSHSEAWFYELSILNVNGETDLNLGLQTGSPCDSHPFHQHKQLHSSARQFLFLKAYTFFGEMAALCTRNFRPLNVHSIPFEKAFNILGTVNLSHLL